MGRGNRGLLEFWGDGECDDEVKGGVWVLILLVFFLFFGGVREDRKWWKMVCIWVVNFLREEIYEWES